MSSGFMLLLFCQIKSVKTSWCNMNASKRSYKA